MPRVVTDREEVTRLRDLDVVSWRFEQLEAAGYPIDVAIVLAERAEVDLHVACDLLAGGATLEEALGILT